MVVHEHERMNLDPESFRQFGHRTQKPPPIVVVPGQALRRFPQLVTWHNAPGISILNALAMAQSNTAGFLSHHERPERTSVYLALLADADPNVRLHALLVATWINRYNPSPRVLEEALKLLKDLNEDVQGAAVHALWQMNHEAIPRADVLPLLNSSRFDTVMVAMRLVEGNGLIQRPLSEAETVAREEALRARRLTSTEATVLATNRLSQVRLTSLKILERNGDAKAVELVLPLLRDPNSVVRSRAFATLQAISGTSVSENDPAKWEKWWADNKATLKPRD
jgi:HEAT repeat protein